jgi:glucuronate isomerase
MKPFMNEDFLLENEPAKTLFHQYAAHMPIVDYHCHINPAEMYKNKQFTDIAEAWLGGDHYKWRLMRIRGVSERLITGDAPGWEKFQAFAEVLPRSVGNPVYHWTHLELKRFFGCDMTLNPDTARDIWNFCNDRLVNNNDLRVRGIISKAGVKAIITTDDPADSLEWHRKLAGDKTFETKVFPGWRPDAVMNIEESGFVRYVKRLEDVSGIKIANYSDLKNALKNRLEFFIAHGCRACDHGIQSIVYAPAAEGQINDVFVRRMRGGTLNDDEMALYRYGMLLFLAKEYSKMNWVMEIHLGAVRNVNSVMFEKLGPDSGYDYADNVSGMTGVGRFFDELEVAGKLPKTLVFSINPADNLSISTLAGCFHQEGIKGKVQQGSAWWFNDTFGGMEQQIKSFAEEGVLADYVGMLTDSRSFLSYARHEYFRRILCNIIGEWVDSGKYPEDMYTLGGIVQDICFNNAMSYFNI